MRIGLVGPAASTEGLINLAKAALPHIELAPLNYRRFTETVELIKKQEQNFDALLFTGQSPYRYAGNFLAPTIPWEYIPRDSLALFAAVIKGLRPTGSAATVSTDSYDSGAIAQITAECKYNDLPITFKNECFDILSPDYFESIIAYHAQNYFNHGAALCVTGNQYVYEALLAQNVPAVKIKPSAAAFRRKLELLCQKHTLNTPCGFAVLAVTLDFGSETSFSSELYRAKAAAKAMEDIYFFCTRTQAAVFKMQSSRYYIAMPSAVLLAETDNLRHISLLGSVLEDNSLNGAAIGIGISDNPQEAKAFALKAEAHAQKGSRCCYALDKSNYLIGPITLDCTQRQQKTAGSITRISQKSGVSVKNVQLLLQAVMQYKLTETTPNEMAHYCNLSLRNMNRIIEKLQDAGFVEILGTKSPDAGPGRPRRIIKFRFD